MLTIGRRMILCSLLPVLMLSACEECPTFEACEGTERNGSDLVDTDTDTDTESDPGEAVYESKCSGCHGSDGSSGYAPDLPDEVPGMSAMALEDVIVNGEDDMPPITMSADDLALVVDYVLDTWGD
jgi:mono/diheme cytochrome c family protein